jgi:hypothetical protein
MSDNMVKRMGRPRQSEEAKRVPVSFRTTPAMSEKIAAAAAASGRSVAQEVEARLELSFQEERIMGGSDTALLSKLIASAVAMIEIESGKPWTEDRMTWEAVNAAVGVTLRTFQPPIDLDIWDRHRDSALLPFLDEASKLALIREEIEGLTKAYPIDSEMPEGARSLLYNAWKAYGPQLERVREKARIVFDGPIKEHEERRRAAVSMGRELGTPRQMAHRGNAVIGGVARMFFASGAFEPLPGLKDEPSEEEILGCVRTIAGKPPADPDMDADAFATRQPNWLDIEED